MISSVLVARFERDDALVASDFGRVRYLTWPATMPPVAAADGAPLVPAPPGLHTVHNAAFWAKLSRWRPWS
jgi:hypothetical protein